MGYTHYWKRPMELDAERFERLGRDVVKLLDHLPEHTTSAGGYYAEARVRVAGPEGTGKPKINGREIVFNGRGMFEGEHLGHEAFYLPRVFTPRSWQQPDEYGRYFDFCKTARKPYDVAVVAVLMSLQHHFPKVIIHSDGHAIEWSAGLDLCQRLFGYGKLPPSIAADTHDAYLDKTANVPADGFEALQAFPIPDGHNLNSTAAQEQRSHYIEAVLRWWNRYGLEADRQGLIDHRLNPRV